MKKFLLAAALSIGVPATAHAASAVLKSPEGPEMGTLLLVQTADGVHITGEVRGLEPGVHAFHIHETGKCDGPDFTSAGGHYNPDGTPHGKQGGGPHAGDMDNIDVLDSGPVTIDVYNDAVTLNAPAKATLFDEDGSAIVFHAGPDDYTSQPAGDAGARVACGVIQ